MFFKKIDIVELPSLVFSSTNARKTRKVTIVNKIHLAKNNAWYRVVRTAMAVGSVIVYLTCNIL